MKKIDIENFKSAMLLISVGTYGCLLDIWNGAENLLPEFLSFVLFPQDKFAFIITPAEVTIHGAFLLFNALGCMLLASTMSGVKAKYTIKGYIKIIVLKCKLKYYTGLQERENWINERRRK